MVPICVWDDWWEPFKYKLKTGTGLKTGSKAVYDQEYILNEVL